LDGLYSLAFWVLFAGAFTITRTGLLINDVRALVNRNTVKYLPVQVFCLLPMERFCLKWTVSNGFFVVSRYTCR
jgi:hypothetical protein